MTLQKKSLSLAMAAITFITSMPLSMAAVNQTVTAEQLKSAAPIYLEVMIGRTEKSNKQEYFGNMEISSGKITIAKEILIDSDELLNNVENDWGTPSNGLNFDFWTELNKGMIVKVFPGEAVDSSAKLKIASNDHKTLVAEENVLEIPLMEMAGGNYFEQKNPDYQVTVKVLPFKAESSLEERNLSFKNRLEICSRLAGVERWSRGRLEAGKISDFTYKNLNKLVNNCWSDDYSNEKLAYFRWRYERLKKRVNDQIVTADMFYGGLNNLLNKKL